MVSKTAEEVIVRLFSAFLFSVSLGVAVPHAADTAFSSQALRVGKTNIFCVQMPCPWRGIAAAESSRAVPADLLWSQQTLPPLAASPEDSDRIVEAWNSDQCLLIDGGFAAGKLQVDRILGDCA